MCIICFFSILIGNANKHFAVTRPKPAYGRQGLGWDLGALMCFGVSLTGDPNWPFRCLDWKCVLKSIFEQFLLLKLNYPLCIDFTNSDDVPILLCDTKQLISCHFFAKILFNLVVHNLCFVENLTCSSFTEPEQEYAVKVKNKGRFKMETHQWEIFRHVRHIESYQIQLEHADNG